MTVRELTKNQLEELKEMYFIQLLDSDEDILEDIETAPDIPDEIIFNHYEHVTFVEDDFFCQANDNLLYINGNRNGYSVDQCGETLTVKELIEVLQEFDEDLPIYLINDNGYTYGSITRDDIYTKEDYEQ